MNKNTAIYLLRETSTTPSEVEILENNEKEVKINAILQDLDVYNRNGRKYGGQIVEEGLSAPHILELQENRSWMGEYGHPLSDDVKRQVTIDGKYISHEIIKTSIDGNKVRGIISSIPTQYGREFRDLIMRGTKVAFSLRALGKVEKSKTNPGFVDVVKPFRIVTYDCVILPSHQAAYQTGIISESVSEKSLMIGEKQFKNPRGHRLLVPNSTTLKESLILVDIAKSIANNSDNVKAVQEALEFAYDKIYLSENQNSMILESNGSELIIPLENYASKMARNIITDIFKK